MREVSPHNGQGCAPVPDEGTRVINGSVEGLVNVETVAAE